MALLEHDIRKSVELWSQGKLSLKEIKKYTGEDLYAIARIGYFLITQGKYQEACILFEGLIAVDPDNDYCYRALGVIFQETGQHVKAVREFTQAIKINPNSPYAYVNRAEIYLSLREFDLAERDLRDALYHVSASDRQLEQKTKSLLRVVCEAEL